MGRKHPAEILAEATHDHSKDLDLHSWRDFTGRLQLDSFLAGDRAASWAAASHDDRRGLVLQQLRRAGAIFENADVERWVLHYTEKYMGATAIAPEPPADLVVEQLAAIEQAQRAAMLEARADASRACSAGADTGEALQALDMHRREMNAANKAAAMYARGLRPLLQGRDYLLESSDRSTVYRIRGGSACSCAAGVNGRACWHVALVAAVMTAYDLHALRLEQGLITRIAAARRALVAA